MPTCCSRCRQDYSRCQCVDSPALAVTPAQRPYVERCLADSDAVYAQEVREFNARRAAAKAATGSAA